MVNKYKVTLKFDIEAESDEQAQAITSLIAQVTKPFVPKEEQVVYAKLQDQSGQKIEFDEKKNKDYQGERTAD